MNKRPISVMVYSGILILNAIINLWTVLTVMAVQQDDATAQTSMEEVHKITTADYLVNSMDGAIFLACGIGFFLRQGWMRFLLIGWVAFTLLYSLLNQELTVYHTVRALFFIGVMAAFMFSAKVNAWFSGKETASPTET